MMHATDAINAIQQSLHDISGLYALFLSGSHGTGLQDDFSDIDFILVAEEGATDAVADHWHKAVSAVGEIVLWWDRTHRPSLINAITADWTRIDVIILKPGQLGGQSQDCVKPVFDHNQLYDQLPAKADIAKPTPQQMLRQIEDFIRILGLLPLAVGRKEYINGVLGVFFLRNALVNLMIEETNAPRRGGILHLNRLISPEQKDVLMGMPAPVPEKQAMIDGHMAYAAAYFPMARQMAARHGVIWPEAFEAATWKRLKQALDLEAPRIMPDD